MLIKSCITDAFSFYKKLRRENPYTALLESLGDFSESNSSYNFIGACPQKMLTVREGSAHLLDLMSGAEEKGVDWRSIIDSWVSLGAEGSHQPYQTGCIGYVGYDRKNDFEIYANQIPQDTQIPDTCLVLYGAVLVVDRKTFCATWVVDDEMLVPNVLEYERLATREDTSGTAPAFVLCGDIEIDTDEEQHQKSVEQIIEYIKAGDVFQVNFTARYRGKYQGDVINLYEALRAKTPNPYFALLDFPQPLISTSPESFLKIEDQHICASPIKGTSCCDINGEDQRNILSNSIKDRAENVMIADLMRNDLGRICEQGSVNVDELCAIRRFNQIYHLESTVSGKLRTSTMMSAVLAATFPCGSITGAPKIRAVEIIEELENSRRGPYCGSIGFFGSLGWVSSCVGIRIIYFDEESLYFHAGGGIVVDSIAMNEYSELKLKAESIKSTLESFNIMNNIRRKIDQIDDELFKIVNFRFQAIQEASRIKAQYGVPVVQRNRMDQMIACRARQLLNNAPMSETIVSDLYAVLTKHSMNLERQAQP